jgi:signal transduction histidine kinase/DNA-binding response OmpR family regulator
VDPPAVTQADRIGIEALVQQLTANLADAVEQQTVTSEVLQAIGRSGSELQPVFETVVRHAVRLCAADAGMVYQLDGDVYQVAVALGGSAEYRRYLQAHPVPQGTGTLVGRVGLERRTVQIADAVADPQYQWREAWELGGFRTMLGVPMLADGRVVGVIALWRSHVDPFDERTIELVTTFAAQGVIAIRNVQLLQELEQRSKQLSSSVDELRALGEVSQAVSSSLDLDEVLTTIVTRAAELSGADGGSIFEFEPSTAEFVLRTCAGTSQALVQTLHDIRIGLDETFIGQAAATGEVRQAPDLDVEPHDPHVDALRQNGWRSMVAVPLRREDEIIGALIVRRTVRGDLPVETVRLLETLANQSVVAIHNARVFHQLERKTRELEVASQHKSDFLASMSHELRTPLNAVIGFSDVLLDRMFGELNERQDEYVRDIRNSGRHLLELINEILDLSKVEAGQMELDLDAVSLPELIEHGLAMVRERAGGHGISLTRDVDPELATAHADELKLKQVIVNLLSNAVKFTPDGGAVTVTARRVGTEAHVSVRDTGVGIPAAEQERVFEAFQRGGRAARTSTEGTGLGLTLSKRIIDLHGGRLWMESEPGVGSTFSFAIPLVHASAAPTDRPPEPSEPVDVTSDGTGNILVVEDDRRSADLLRVYLEDAGYAVSIARDGVAGLELAGRLRPAAVILDVLLPRLNGWDLLAQLKSDPATSEIPVVIVSMTDDQGAGFALGAADYLVKPVDRARLLGALSRCAQPRREPPTLVAIDDDPVDLDLLEAVLAPEGWRVVRATGGEEGLRAVREERPAVVVLDLLMPGLDGFAVIEQLRADPLVGDVPVVVLTSKEMTRADRERLAGQISFLAQKGSFPQSELVSLVGRVAGSRRPGVATT